MSNANSSDSKLTWVIVVSGWALTLQVLDL